MINYKTIVTTLDVYDESLKHVEYNMYVEMCKVSIKFCRLLLKCLLIKFTQENSHKFDNPDFVEDIEGQIDNLLELSGK